ncbi:MAG: hypothetical protein ACRD5H_07295 [Nitrososphaerales archaeon]
MAARLCKYECGQQLTWDNGKSKFVEADGTEHSKERCAYLKSLKKPISAPPTIKDTPDYQKNQEQIQRMHEDNQKMHGERLSFDKLRLDFDRQNRMAIEGQTKALTELTSTVLAQLARTEALYEQAQIGIRMLVESDLFKTAANILAKEERQ